MGAVQSDRAAKTCTALLEKHFSWQNQCKFIMTKCRILISSMRVMKVKILTAIFFYPSDSPLQNYVSCQLIPKLNAEILKLSTERKTTLFANAEVHKFIWDLRQQQPDATKKTTNPDELSDYKLLRQANRLDVKQWSASNNSSLLQIIHHCGSTARKHRVTTVEKTMKSYDVNAFFKSLGEFEITRKITYKNCVHKTKLQFLDQCSLKRQNQTWKNQVQSSLPYSSSRL